jgi:hypothetical protein
MPNDAVPLAGKRPGRRPARRYRVRPTSSALSRAHSLPPLSSIRTNIPLDSPLSSPPSSPLTSTPLLPLSSLPETRVSSSTSSSPLSSLPETRQNSPVHSHTASPSPPPSLPSSSSSSSDSSPNPYRYTRPMPYNKNTTYVEQSAVSKLPILHPGDISPEVMREFEDSCMGYFDAKEVEPDRQVQKVISGLKDPRIRDWVTTDRARILLLTFAEFMTEMRCNFLDPNWEDLTRRELGSMTQSGDGFWNFTIRLQAKNSLLMNTTSHLDEEGIRHRLEASMDDALVRHCMNASTNCIEEFREWTQEVKKLDDQMRAERKEFEQIAKAQRENTRHANPMGEPSTRANTVNNNNNSRGTKAEGNLCLPKLTSKERQLLFDNEGCLKCHRPFAGHRSMNCPNDFPSATNYRPLTQGDIDKAKKPSCTVAAVSNTTLDENNMTTSHPVAAVMGSSNAPVAYIPNNASSVIEGGNESDDSVSHSFPSHHANYHAQVAAIAPTQDIAPLKLPHLLWRCAIFGGLRNEFPTILTVLLDCGSHLVLIDESLANQLHLKRSLLPQPEKIELALLPDGPKEEIELHEWVPLEICDPSLSWKVKTVRAVVALRLCTPVVLGLPFLSHNSIVIDYAIPRVTDVRETIFRLAHDSVILVKTNRTRC